VPGAPAVARVTLLGPLRSLGAMAVVFVLIVTLSPVYRDFFADRRDRNRGTSVADFLGPMAYDHRVLNDFSWGGWFWNPDKALGFPRMQDLGTRPLYPVQLALLRWLPVERAWHWNHVAHVLLKLGGLVLLGEALAWPFWIVVLAAAGAMLADGALSHFSDTTILTTTAWLPIQLWLTLRAARAPAFSGWDAAWALASALRATSFHPQWGTYYEILILLVTLRVEWSALSRRWPALLARYAAYGLLLMPWLLPAGAHYLESGRRHIAKFEDWHLRRAYVWWKSTPPLREFPGAIFMPWGVWVLIALGLVVGRLRGTRLWPAFGLYFVFGLFHAVPWLALPMWITGIALLPFRIPTRVFEPFTWLGILLLAEIAAVEGRGRRRAVLAGLLVAAFAVCAWQTRFDPATGYIHPPWPRGLPERLAALVRADPAPALFPTDPDQSKDDNAPLLNSNHNLALGIPGAHFLGEIPSYAFMRATYRLPGVVFMQRAPTQLAEWDLVVDVYAELGIGWVFWDGAGEPVHPRLRFVGAENGFRLYRIEGARPHIYALDQVRRVPPPRAPVDVAALVYSLPALGPFCEGCPADATASPLSEVRLTSVRRPGDVEIEVESLRGTLVVLGETRSRGWQASVDGVTREIYPLNEVFQAVTVPPGRHRIHWRFASPGFFAGLALAGLGLIVLAVALVAGRRRRGPEDV
jgi:hypothetical protein